MGGQRGTPKALVLDCRAKVCPTRAYTCDRMGESRGAASRKRTSEVQSRKTRSGAALGGNGRLTGVITREKGRKRKFCWQHGRSHLRTQQDINGKQI